MKKNYCTHYIGFDSLNEEALYPLGRDSLNEEELLQPLELESLN
jgi:hypothetical protein